MKILIVEDETKLAESVKNGLRQEGYIADIVGDGELALSRVLLDTKAYDLILLDVMLPGKNGFSVCQELREKKITTPILMLTARDTKEDIMRGLDDGADDYLVKPFSFGELLARIRALLRRPPKAFFEVLETRGIILNESSKQVTLHGKPISLTPKELLILEFLMRRANEVVSRETILANIWDFAFNSFSNVVDVHIKNLRKKINQHEELLETVRGKGYRLKA